MIAGVKIKKLKILKDGRGRLMEIFRVSEEKISPKQIYMTTAFEGVVKDKDKFHLHKRQTDHFCCIKGIIKLVLVDTRPKSKTKGQIDEFEVGDNNFCLVTIPNGVLHAFKSLKGESIIINCINHEYSYKDPDESRIDNKFYDWDKAGAIK